KSATFVGWDEPVSHGSNASSRGMLSAFVCLSSTRASQKLPRRPFGRPESEHRGPSDDECPASIAHPTRFRALAWKTQVVGDRPRGAIVVRSDRYVRVG